MSRARKGISLEAKLPLLITGLLTALVVSGSLLGYHELRELTIDSRSERLVAASSQLATLVDETIRARMRQLQEAAEDPRIRELLENPEQGDREAAQRALAALDPAPEVLVRALLLGPERQVLVSVEGFPAEWSPEQADSARALVSVPPEGGYSELIAVAGTRVVWALVPIKGGDERLGEAAVLRTVAQSSSSAMRELLAGESTFYFANPGSGTWITLDGDILPAPLSPPPLEPTFYQWSDGSRRLGAGAKPAMGEFIVVAEFPASVVFARSYEFARRMVVGSLFLILAGIMGAWLVSRGITAPLRALLGASEGLAGGDYSRRVATDRDDELGELAQTFNTMATRVEEAQGRLQAQYEEAREMAEAIESANRQLTDAVESAQRSHRAAEDANQAKSDFVAMISHELRSPIHAIVGYADLLDMEVHGTLTPEQKVQIERIRSNGNHLTTLIGQVLDLSRVESGKLPLEMETRLLQDVVDQAITTVSPAAGRKGVTLQASVGVGAAIMYKGDEGGVRQILTNLISNAVKFTESGGRISVESFVAPADWKGPPHSDDLQEVECGWACVTVRDTGVGITEDMLEAVFEPFVQAGRHGSQSGVGLGLAISRRLARQMGGDLTVSSEPGEGSAFTLFLAPPSARTGEGVGAGKQAPEV